MVKLGLKARENLSTIEADQNTLLIPVDGFIAKYQQIQQETTESVVTIVSHKVLRH